ncbi:MAG: 3'-5' exonuclease, partial [Candidatus Heimdallarchaeota archaeon]
MGLEDFFETTQKKEEVEEQEEKKNIEKTLEEIEESNLVEEKLGIIEKQVEDMFTPQEFELGQDIEDIFLLDVIYEAKSSKAQCIFYHEPSQSLYKWNDNTGHRPYLLTYMTEESLNKIDKIVKSDEFVKMETVKRFDLLNEKEIELTKVYGTNPLAIGGRGSSFREFTGGPTFEADIRYHFNYVTEMKITPGTYYKVKDGNLYPSSTQIDSDVEKELTRAFRGQEKEQLQMLDEYMPLLFQKIPDVLRCGFDIEVGSSKGVMPNPNKPV